MTWGATAIVWVFVLSYSALTASLLYIISGSSEKRYGNNALYIKKNNLTSVPANKRVKALDDIIEGNDAGRLVPTHIYAYSRPYVWDDVEAHGFAKPQSKETSNDDNNQNENQKYNEASYIYRVDEQNNNNIVNDNQSTYNENIQPPQSNQNGQSEQSDKTGEINKIASFISSVPSFTLDTNGEIFIGGSKELPNAEYNDDAPQTEYGIAFIYTEPLTGLQIKEIDCVFSRIADWRIAEQKEFYRNLSDFDKQNQFDDKNARQSKMLVDPTLLSYNDLALAYLERCYLKYGYQLNTQMPFEATDEAA